MITKLKLLGFGLGALGILATVFAGYMYVTNLQQENAILLANEAKYQTAIELRTAEVEDLQKGLEDLGLQLAAVNAKLSETRREREEKKRIFDDHEFNRLLQGKPTLIERRMVTGTAGMFRDFEQASRN